MEETGTASGGGVCLSGAPLSQLRHVYRSISAGPAGMLALPLVPRNLRIQRGNVKAAFSEASGGMKTKMAAAHVFDRLRADR